MATMRVHHSYIMYASEQLQCIRSFESNRVNCITLAKTKGINGLEEGKQWTGSTVIPLVNNAEHLIVTKMQYASAFIYALFFF